MYLMLMLSPLTAWAREFLTVLQTFGPMEHVDRTVASTPGLLALLDDLSRLALAHMRDMDTWAIPNILWALAILHQNPLGG